MKHIKTIKSSVDEVYKYQFLADDKRYIEFSFIDKKDGKHIICAPSSTSCAMSCSFCHVTGIAKEIINRNVTEDEYNKAIGYILSDKNNLFSYPVLISFMGVGEPFTNITNITKFMKNCISTPFARFAICSSFPKHSTNDSLKLLNELLKDSRFENRFKLHISIHEITDKKRQQIMPYSLSLNTIIDHYKKFVLTNPTVSIEFHHTLTGNNTSYDIAMFYMFIRGKKNVKVKFLKYNEIQDTSNLFCAGLKDKTAYDRIVQILDRYDIKHEYYVPPGQDIGSSCGQLSRQDILKYNKRKLSWWEKLKIDLTYITSKTV